MITENDINKLDSYLNDKTIPNVDTNDEFEMPCKLIQ